MSYLSLACDCDGWPVLIVGAGNRVAGRRARLLLAAGARIRVVAPEIGSEIDRLAAAGELQVERRRWQEPDLDGIRLVLAATDDDALNRAIVAAAEALGILGNCASSGTSGRVLFPARYRSRGVEVAVHDQGGSVRRVLHIRDRIANVLEASGELARPVPVEGGQVYLIGAGPGAPDLLTLRALRAIQAADVVITDQILGADFLDRIDVDCRDKDVVRLAGGTDSPARQQAINERLVADARRGLVVARVKNGDPLVFGRGGEEAAHLDAHGVRWEFIPGLSSSVSLLTNAGFPVTNRGDGRSFAVVSARLAGGALNTGLPRADSLIFLMGFKVFGAIREQLLADGWDPAGPAAIIERGGLPFERRIRARLDQLVERAEAMGLRSPAIVVVGAAAHHRFASPLRPCLLFTGPDPAPYRAVGDLLHWPVVTVAGQPHPDLDLALPEHDGILVTDPAEYEAWSARHGCPHAVWTDHAGLAERLQGGETDVHLIAR